MRILAVYLILLVHVMDTAIANVALVNITTDLGIDAYDGHWMITAFGVGMAGTIPFVPKIVEWLGAATALTATLAISVLAIALCGVADTLFVLGLSRFLQGVTSGAVVLLLQKLLMQYVGPERKAFGLALWTSAISIAPVIGPFFGAATMAVLDWRWMFFAQIPVLLLAALCIGSEFSLRPSSPGPRPPALPAVFLFGAMLGLELGLDHALDLGRDDKTSAILYLLAVPLNLLLLRIALRRNRQTLFDWSLLRNASYRCYTGNAALLSAASICTSLVYTVWLQMQLNLALLDVAKVLAAGGLIAGAMSVLIGRIRAKALFPALIAAGLLCFASGFYLCTRLSDSAELFDLVLPRVLIGLGTALCSPAGFMAISDLAAERVFAANSLGLYTRTIVCNVAIVLSAATARRLELLLREESLASGFGTPLAGLQAGAAALHDALGKMAATDAMHLIFWSAIALLAGLLCNLLREQLRQSAAPRLAIP